MSGACVQTDSPGAARGRRLISSMALFVQLKAELSALEASWRDDVTELEAAWRQLEDVRRRQLELAVDADDERKQVSHVTMTSPVWDCCFANERRFSCITA